MRYIPKQNEEPECLSSYKTSCREAGVQGALLYRDFNNTGQLKKVLCEEQHNVCCYCQRPVKSFRIEHLYPENGPDKDKGERLQLEYSNLFASCMDSQWSPKQLRHCDVAKQNFIIREFIKEEQCQSYFRYLSTGEIVPNGTYYTWADYEQATDLSQDEIDAMQAIKVLNLNCVSLVEERKECLTDLMRLIPKRSKDEWQQQIDKWLSLSTYPAFIELRLQYLRQYVFKSYGSSD